MEDEKIIKLINSDLIIGKAGKGDNDMIVVENPYTVKDLGNGPCVMPYELDMLMEPMKTVGFHSMNILWIKNLKDFNQVQEQYELATSGVQL